MKFYFLFYVLLLGQAFLNSSQNDTCILIWEHKKTSLLYIVCNMRFEEKAYESNLLNVHYLQIELQL